MMRYEWKKIFERRLNLAAMAAGYILVAVCLFSWISQASFWDEKTGSYIEGTSAVRASREKAKEQPGYVSEEYVTSIIGWIQEHEMDMESDDAYLEIIRPLGDIYYFIARNYTDMSEKYLDGNALMKVDLTGGARFYEQRMNKITSYLNMDFSYGNYKESEKEYWIQKAENTEVPFVWGDKSVMDILWDSTVVGIYLCFVIIICVSSVFASEYESGAAHLLLTTRYGKDRMIWAKIAVSLLFAAGYLLVGILFAAGTVGVLFGFSGKELPVQLWNSVIPYNLTVWQAYMGNCAVLLLIGITLALVLLFCSAKLRSSLATLVVGMLLLIGPAFLPMSKESGLWNHINYLFPARAVNLKEMLGAYVSYTAGNHVIPYVGMMAVVYAAVGAAALLLVRRSFVKAG